MNLDDLIHEQEFPKRDIGDPAHAIYAIARYLDALNLGHWAGVIIGWLGQYDGFERYDFEETWPVVQVRDMLASYVSTGQRLYPNQLVKALVALPFVYLGARHENIPGRWNPLQQPFIEFENLGPQVWVWQSEERHPPSEDTEEYLFSAYV
ncbi:MAG: hypothetical protein H7315_15265, partial [Herminiimonas sp.]|nr:hypothetical protein [Herminiimonas sp.]